MSTVYVTAGLTVLIQLGVAIWVFAKLTERVDGHGRWIKTIDTEVKEHETRISTLEGALR